MSLIPGFIKKPIGCVLSILVGGLLMLLVLMFVVVIVVDYFAVSIAAHELHQRSGFTMTVAKHDIGMLSGSADVFGLQITNPDRFAAKDFINFNELKAKVEVSPLLHKQIVVDEIVVDLDCLTIVQDKDGEYNFEALQKSLLGGSSAPAAPAAGGAKSTGMAIPPFTIKKLTLRIHSAKYYNFKSSADGALKTYDLSYDRTFTDVSDKNLTSVEVAIGTDLAGKGFSVFLDILKDKLLDPDTYMNAVKGVGNLVGNAAGAVLNGVGNAAKGVGDLAKKLIP